MAEQSDDSPNPWDVPVTRALDEIETVEGLQPELVGWARQHETLLLNMRNESITVDHAAASLSVRPEIANSCISRLHSALQESLDLYNEHHVGIHRSCGEAGSESPRGGDDR